MRTDKAQEGTQSSIPPGAYEEQEPEQEPTQAEEPVSTDTPSGSTLAPSDFVVSREDNSAAHFLVDVVAEEKKRRQIELNRRLRRTSRGAGY